MATLKSSIEALANNIGKCQENPRSLKSELERGLMDMADNATSGGGSTVTVTPVLESGTKIATIGVDESSYDLYCETVPATMDADDVNYDNTTSGLTATDVQAAIDEIAQGGGGGGSYELVWTNADPTTGIDDTTPLSIANANQYTYFVFEIIANSSYADKPIMTGAANLGSTSNQVGIYGLSSGATVYYYRTFTTTSSTMVLTLPKVKNLGAWTDTNDVATNYIPLHIYGIK